MFYILNKYINIQNKYISILKVYKYIDIRNEYINIIWMKYIGTFVRFGAR